MIIAHDDVVKYTPYKKSVERFSIGRDEASNAKTSLSFLLHAIVGYTLYKTV